MPVAVLQQFATAFAHSANKALQRFCALQSQGGDQPTVINKQLRTQVYCRASLSMGLDWLAQLDLRATWQFLSMPTLLLLAAEDALVPATVASDLHKVSHGDKTIATLNGCHALAWQYAQAGKDKLLSRIGVFLEQSDV
jgi:pimeloyl-[acyl-carrier protein] methyl ester esterase